MKPHTLTLQNSALLVIDVINSCAHPDCEDPQRGIHYTRIRRMVPALSTFMSAYRELGGRTLLTTTVPWQEPYLPENINQLYHTNPQARYWSKDSTGFAERFYQIPTQGARIFAKNRYDAFTNAGLVQTLEEMKVRYIMVAGVFGDGCVLSSVFGGFSKGYHMVMLKDLIETTDDEDRQAFQQFLKQRMWPLMYGPTVESREIMAGFADELHP